MWGLIIKPSGLIKPSGISIAVGLRATRRFFAGVLGFLLLVLGAPAAGALEVFDSGHLDAFNVIADHGQLKLTMKEDITGSSVVRPGDDVVLKVKESAWSSLTTQVPAIGQPTYFLPQTQDQNLVWPGWDTQEAGAHGFSAVDLNFAQVTGPGAVFVFELNSLGAISAVTNTGSMQLTSGSVITQPFPAHRHVNWAFTQPGRYTMEVYATSAGQTSNHVTYTWQVGEGTASPTAVATTPTDRSAASNLQTPASAVPAVPAGAAGAPVPPGAPAAPALNAVPELPQVEQQPADQVVPEGTPQPAAPDETCVPGITPLIKDDRTSPPRWVEANGQTFAVGEKARVTLPSAVGPIAQGEVWMIGSTQVPGVPWLGANTQHPSMRELVPGAVTWELTAFDGPGIMFVYTQGGLGTTVGQEWFRASPSGFAGSYSVHANSHIHPNWMFSAPGTYHVTIRQSGVTAAGKAIAGQATLTFVVGNDAAAAAPAGAFDNGHFDLGGEVLASGGACADGAPGAAGTAPGAAPSAAATTATTATTSAAAATSSTTTPPPVASPGADATNASGTGLHNYNDAPQTLSSSWTNLTQTHLMWGATVLIIGLLTLGIALAVAVTRLRRERS